MLGLFIEFTAFLFSQSYHKFFSAVFLSDENGVVFVGGAVIGDVF